VKTFGHWASALTSLLLMGFTAIVAALGPAILWARERDAINAATGHLPDMNPGITVYLAAFLLAPFLLVSAGIEVGRLIAGGAPLHPPAAALLGALVGAPIGLRYFGGMPPLGWLPLVVWFVVVAALFYGVRSRRRRQAAGVA
jgi:hypothetical protein